MSEWISVKDRLPESGASVIMGGKGWACPGCYGSNGDGKPYFSFLRFTYEPTHWMPFPKPPQREVSENGGKA